MSGDTFDEIENRGESEDPSRLIVDLQGFVGPAAAAAVAPPASPERTVQGPPARRPVRPSPSALPAQTASATDSNPQPVVTRPRRERRTARSDDAEPNASSTAFGGRPSQGGLGHRRGNQRALGLYLPRNVREALEARRVASRESRGAILLVAFRVHYQRLLSEHAPAIEEDPRFGKALRSPRKVEDGAMVTFYVPDAQAKAIADVASELSVSVSEAATMALSLELIGSDSLEAEQL